MSTTTKLTLAHLKRFVERNRERLHIMVQSDFDGMTDCVEDNHGATFKRALPSEFISRNTLGVSGIWLVLRSRDRFSAYEDQEYTGIRCYNCCGSWVVAVKREEVRS